MSILFENGDWIPIADRPGLEATLEEIHRSRVFESTGDELSRPSFSPSGDSEERSRQQFLQFDGDKARARGFVGFIQHGSEVIEIYPKVFARISEAQSRQELMLRHMFHWLEHSSQSRLRFDKASLGSMEIDEWPEVLIGLIATQIHSIVSVSPFMNYQRVEEVLVSPRGSIDFPRYVTTNLSVGNFHRIDCNHEPFIFDNKLNRLIKFCARILMDRTKNPESYRLLQEITFIFSEVQDEMVSPGEVGSIQLNPFFADYREILEVCRFILENLIHGIPSADSRQWSLLIPMAYLYEDYLSGVLREWFSDEWKVETQKSDRFVADEPRAFQMRHDIMLTSKENGRRIIVDAKYKLRSRDFKNDIKKGIDQGDLYQMITYAVKRGCDEVMILYPNLSDVPAEPDRFVIDIDGFWGMAESDRKITLTAAEIPFWNSSSVDDLTESAIETISGLLAL
jgi:5-methylcytosine-specific restriction enzyme subunit McrC